MPLDTSSYSLALLRLDGRRWNELRRINAQLSTLGAANGSSYLEMGNTKVICTVVGPAERRAGGGGMSSTASSTKAEVRVEINIASFSGVDRKRRGRGDKKTNDMQEIIANAFTSSLFTHLYPRSTISIMLQVLSQDGSLLAACINAATLALVDAGVSMPNYLAACTSGSMSAHDEDADPVLDLSGLEEQELPFLTIATLGEAEKVAVLVMDTKVHVKKIEGMLAVGVDGCKQVREIMDQAVRRHGANVLRKSGDR